MSDVLLWGTGDCIDFVRQSIESYGERVADEITDAICHALKTNVVTGSSLVRFTDEDWRELIPAMGLRIHIRDSFNRIVGMKENVSVSQLHDTGSRCGISRCFTFSRQDVAQVSGRQHNWRWFIGLGYARE